jgi:hypothetical protein
MRRQAKSFKVVWRLQKRKHKKLSVINALYFKQSVKLLNKRRKKKKLVTSLKIRRKYFDNLSNVVLKSGFRNRYIGNRKIGRIRKRAR